MPIYYQCQRCTACCRWPGQVRISPEEIAHAAEFLGITNHEFIQRYTELNRNRSGLVLRNKPNEECLFLEGNECRIHRVKPRQCRDFPNGWNFPGFEAVCRAEPHEVTALEWERLVGRKAPVPVDG